HTGLFMAGRAAVESFWFNDHHPMTQQEIEPLLRPYAAFKRGQPSFTDDKMFYGMDLMYPDGSYYAVVMYDKAEHRLTIWRADVFSALFRERTFDDEPVTQSAFTTPKRDCAVVATENLHRLASTAAWSNILFFEMTSNGVQQE